METNGRARLRFGDFEFDSEAAKLLRAGQAVRIQPQPLRVLRVLIERPGEIVSRDELRVRIWGEATFVEFDQGLNYCIRQIRMALRDSVSTPSYIETLPKQGYRFIASVSSMPNGVQTSPDLSEKVLAEPVVLEEPANPPRRRSTDLVPVSRVPPPRKRFPLAIAVALCSVLGAAGVVAYFLYRAKPAVVTYTQLTDFTDSATSPALSPDGRMLAFIRGTSFLSVDQVWAKLLPNGEARQLTNDLRLKYNLAFSPDGSQIAYTVLEHHYFSTYAVSVLGGDSRLVLKNAAGLTWLSPTQLLYSEIKSGVHMGVVTGAATGENVREIYFPPSERGMAHYSYASPDRRSALVVEMDEKGEWGPCVLISLRGASTATPVGPRGACTAAGWSADGEWMYFIAAVDGKSHFWRQRFPNGDAEQITFGPTEEEGLAVEKDNHSVITSMGVHESAIWFHDGKGDRSLSSEGEIAVESPPSFSPDGKILYYLMRRRTAGSDAELWRMSVETGNGEPVFPGVSMLAYDVSPDGKQVVYSTTAAGGNSQLWLAAMDRSTAAKRLGDAGPQSQPHFGPRGQILFRWTGQSFNYLEQMNADGTGMSKAVPYPINEIQGVSPGKKWVMAVIPFAEGHRVGVVAIPIDGGHPQAMCYSYCMPVWSPNGNYLYIPVEGVSQTSAGRSLAIPVGPGERLRPFPAGGIKPQSDASVVPGALSVGRGELVPGTDPEHFAYVNTTVHRNLYRISVP